MKKDHIKDYQLYFTYGVKIRIVIDDQKHDCVMILNSQNNFFLDFISGKKSVKLINQVFIP